MARLNSFSMFSTIPGKKGLSKSGSSCALCLRAAIEVRGAKPLLFSLSWYFSRAS